MKQGLAALGEAMAEVQVETETFVTRGDVEKIDTGHGEVQVAPTWRFLLQGSGLAG